MPFILDCMDAVVKELVDTVYPTHPGLVQRIMALVEEYKPLVRAQRNAFRASEYAESDGAGLSEADTILITYGDTFQGDATPLDTLYRFLEEETDGTIGGVHVLPFSPYSSDDGFSVIDYYQVNPTLGGWEQIERIAAEYRLMADLVLNHCSAQSEWFRRFLQAEERYRRYFIVVNPGADLSRVVRPRALPLTHAFSTSDGEKHVWTTFSADQVDLNFEEPEVLLEMLQVLLSYLAHGAQLIRLDAIAYLWKEIGHTCIHHPNTHRIVRLFRRVMELVDPQSILITETNVPHHENVSYFGNGDEAHMVYQFSLPPLLLHATVSGNTNYLQRWASSLGDPGPTATYFNFCASHDGVGLLPSHGILTDEERNALLDTVTKRGGLVSYKSTPAGDIPYELNVNYLSAVTDPNLPPEQRAKVFLATQAVMLALAGVPGIYVHSLIGSENWTAGVEQTGMNRTINREKLEYSRLLGELHDPSTLRYHVFEGYKRLIAARAMEEAFHPKSPQRVLSTESGLFAVVRGPYVDGGHQVVCVHNLTEELLEFRMKAAEVNKPSEGVFRELISHDLIYPTREGEFFSLELQPYEVLWLRT